jgi:oxygen-dependent protoporphyrinogen oxidase
VAGGDAEEDEIVSEASELVGATSPPIAVRTHRWDAALPEFKVGHLVAMERAQATLSDRPMRLAGAGYLATGLNDCIAQGRVAAREVLTATRA